jgi:dienelactone hydrolase/predicted Ser/Thr protein kinase
MPLAVGEKLGPYEVLAPLGAGGMGEVYRARDTRLGRTVAIKLIRSEFAGRSDFRHRFEREAKAISALNHPHVCALYDIGEHEGSAYLVMEYVEGETLTTVMKSLLPLNLALRYSNEIAEALAAAHAQGIVHRDLKPGNIMVTSAGVKVLDFGLARQYGAAAAEASTATLSAVETQAGQVVGTAAYMSPEQAKGEPVDARSDVFALGVVLYEMLCGRHPFLGHTTLMTLSAILQTQPDPPRKLRAEIPPAIELIVLRCLEKQPELRYPSAADLHRELIAVQTSKTTGFSVSRMAAITVGIVMLIGAGAFGWRSYQRASRARWVEETAVPEIARLIQRERRLAALKLFRQAEEYAPASRSLIRLSEGVATRPISFETTPAGAKIYISDYNAAAGEDLSEWQLLGQAPLTFDQIPNWGYYRVRAVKEGFATVDQTFGGANVQLTLPAANAVPPGMVSVPAIEQTFGARAFWMDRYEVTNQQYKKFVDAGGYRKEEYWKQPFVKDGHAISWSQAMTEFHDLTARPGPATWQLGAFPDGAGEVPVGGISWYEAAAYAAFAGKSLPAVDEWRRAAGIGANADILQLSNFGGKGVAPAGAHRGMSSFGTYDMAGNLKEWTTNAANDRRYILGGAWDELSYQFGQLAARPPFSRESTFGFRCVQRSISRADIYGPLIRATVPPRSKPVDDETYRVFLGLHHYEKSALDSRVERTGESSPYWRRETVSFQAAYGNERVIAHLFLPKGAPAPYQVVAVMGGVTIMDIKRIEDFDYPFEFLLRAGRAVIIPAYSGTLERGPSPYNLPTNRERERALKWSMDLGRSIDYLETRPEIDTRKLGFYGLSSGATAGGRLIAVEPRIKVAVFSSGGLSHGEPAETDSWNFLPRVHIPVLMLNGRDDFGYPVETIQNPLFQALGTKEPDKKRILYDGGHRSLVTQPDLIGEILNWLDRYLGPVQARP